jgi:hypothetical protein
MSTEVSGPLVSSTQVRSSTIGKATAMYCVAFLVHNADHARRSVAASPEPVVWAGTMVAMLTAVIVTLVVVDHHYAALAAATGGAAIALGVSLSHLLPKWGALSDPLPGGNLDALTWVAVLLEIVGAVLLSTAGFRRLRQKGLTGEVRRGGR